eukprot:TRINITY_DN1674_c0_g1_i1.p1 TRINITY_DN1674_c0_g1~~TRINITY_DN1674_c0_g1_i1.p1  ORF type:complete len:168 (+),score=39.47 TRINITY_DN1674_c0_g1_i1:133-636(+)
MDNLAISMFCTGTMTCIAGVYVLTYYRWDSEMEKFRREMGLETPKRPGTEEAVSGVGVVPSMQAKADPAPEETKGAPRAEEVETTKIKGKASLSREMVIDVSTPTSLPHATNTSPEVSPYTPSKKLLPPISIPIIRDAPPEDARRARNALRKKRILRKKGMAAEPEI